MRAVIVDHQLQPGSAEVAEQVARQLEGLGMACEVRQVVVPDGPDGVEAAARHARLAALAADGVPVLLGHTLDDQAEQTFLGLVRGSGTRSLAGMPADRSPFLRPLLQVRRATTVAACAEWGLNVWHDPMNDDPSFLRVRVRRWLASFEREVGRDVAPNLARTARLARADADLLDQLVAHDDVDADGLPVEVLQPLPEALRWRRLKRWLVSRGVQPTMEHVLAVDALVTHWRGQGPIDVPGGRVLRHDGVLTLLG